MKHMISALQIVEGTVYGKTKTFLCFIRVKDIDLVYTNTINSKETGINDKDQDFTQFRCGNIYYLTSQYDPFGLADLVDSYLDKEK